MIIEKPTELARLCCDLGKSSTVYLDTEFVGEGRYYPAVGAIQTATDDRAEAGPPRASLRTRGVCTWSGGMRSATDDRCADCGPATPNPPQQSWGFVCSPVVSMPGWSSPPCLCAQALWRLTVPQSVLI